MLERAHSGFELFNTASGALVFIADENGQILLHTGDDAFTGAGVPASYIDELNEGHDIFETGTLDGVYCAKYYTAGAASRWAGRTATCLPPARWLRWAAT